MVLFEASFSSEELKKTFQSVHTNYNLRKSCRFKDLQCLIEYMLSILIFYNIFVKQKNNIITY